MALKAAPCLPLQTRPFIHHLASMRFIEILRRNVSFAEESDPTVPQRHDRHCATWTATSMQSPQVGCGVQTNPLLSAGLWAGGRNQMNKARRGHLRIWEFDSKTSWLQHFNMFLYVFVSILQHISTWQFLWPLSIWLQVEVQLLLRILAQVQSWQLEHCGNYFFLGVSLLLGFQL